MQIVIASKVAFHFHRRGGTPRGRFRTRHQPNAPSGNPPPPFGSAGSRSPSRVWARTPEDRWPPYRAARAPGTGAAIRGDRRRRTAPGRTIWTRTHPPRLARRATDRDTMLSSPLRRGEDKIGDTGPSALYAREPGVSAQDAASSSRAGRSSPVRVVRSRSGSASTSSTAPPACRASVASREQGARCALRRRYPQRG